MIQVLQQETAPETRHDDSAAPLEEGHEQAESETAFDDDIDAD